jgi:aminoglycoside phosphotransferase (APT) family kinase protein
MDLDDGAERHKLELLLGSLAAARLNLLEWRRLTGGSAQENWFLRIRILEGQHRGEHRWVLRTDAPSSLIVSLSRMQEFALLRIAWQHGVRVPEPLFYSPAAEGMPAFFVLHYVSGETAGARLSRDDTLVPDRPALLRELAQMLARVHALPLERVQPIIGTTVDVSLLPRLRDWRNYLSQHPDEHPVLEWGIRWLLRHLPSDLELCVLHRDYRAGNYVVSEGRLVAILDWEFAGFGDPREDLGWFMAACWRGARRDRVAGGIGDAETFLSAYCLAATRLISEEELHYWQVLAHVRAAVLALQQADRHLSGLEPSLELALTARLVPELEWEVLNLTGA